MARVAARPRPERERVLTPVRHDCPGCGGHMRLRYDNRRTLVTLSGPVRLRLRIRRCEVSACRRFHIPYRPEAVGVPVLGVVSDGQTSVRRAVERALPGVPHQLCQFHFLREAAHPVFEADRHAKKELKKAVRGVRPIERALEGRSDPEAEVARGYCAAVRSAITDDGRAPLAASGLKLKARLEAVASSLDRVAEKGGPRRRRSRGSAA